MDNYAGTSEFATYLAQFGDNLPPGARVLNTTGTGAEYPFTADDGYTAEDLDVGDLLSFIEETPYDGIWACRSLNYIPPVELFATLKNLRANLHDGGVYGGVFTTGAGDHVVEQTLRGDFFRARYPAALVLKLHRQAGFKPVTVSTRPETLFILAGAD